MAGCFSTNLLVGRIGNSTAHEARAGTDDAGEFTQVKLPAPKASTGEVDRRPSGITTCLQGVIFLPLNELEREAVDAVASVLRSKALPFENVAQVAATVVAGNFDPVAVGIADLLDGAWYFVVEARPAAAAAELILTVVQRVITAPADEDAVDLEVVVLPNKRHLCAFTDNNTLFFGSEGVVIFRSFHAVLTPEG
ncbi:MAG: hypothetical protein ACI81P_000940 [Neolewinella sp.]|jgi:hypothetical protein